MRIVLDTAILVRGHGGAKGLARDLLIGIVESDHILLLSNEMLYELARVLRYPRMLALHGLSEKRIYDYVGSLREAAEMVVPDPLLVTSLKKPGYSRSRRRLADAPVAFPMAPLRWDTEVVPTVLRSGPYRVYFYSHEPNEPPHVHVDRDAQSAKFWLRPIGLALNLGFSPVELRRIQQMLKENETSLLERWDERF